MRSGIRRTSETAPTGRMSETVGDLDALRSQKLEFLHRRTVKVQCRLLDMKPVKDMKPVHPTSHCPRQHRPQPIRRNAVQVEQILGVSIPDTRLKATLLASKRTFMLAGCHIDYLDSCMPPTIHNICENEGVSMVMT